jgi:UPF0176 protein
MASTVESSMLEPSHTSRFDAGASQADDEASPVLQRTTRQQMSEGLIQIKVNVCRELREELQLSSRERRGRVFLDPSACVTLASLRGKLHGFFRALRLDSYVLLASPPEVSEDGTTLPPEVVNESNSLTISSDEDVRTLIAQAQSLYEQEYYKDRLNRPTMCLRIDLNPNRPAPPPIPEYLKNLPDPAESSHMTMLSFYAFPASGIDDPEAFAKHLRKTWETPFQAVGRIYVANEGVNAQMAVPSNVLDQFIASCHDLPNGVGDYLTNECLGVNIDPVPLTRVDYATAGVNDGPPFHNLHIRVRPQVVSDGLLLDDDDDVKSKYNWNDAGYDMPPEEWHNALQAKGDVTLLDCRNKYESDVGRFEGSEPLNTDTFKDTWDALKERLQDKPKDAPIYTYCTGGIRCVKVGAYLKQELGFTNVNRLAGGIIAYDRAVNKQGDNSSSLFKGTNFVFDGRLGRPITDAKLGTCYTCAAATSLVTNCRNSNCHQRIIQCENCDKNYLGTCSDACHQRVLRMQKDESNGQDIDSSSFDSKTEPRINRPAATACTKANDSQQQFSTLEEYSAAHSSPVPAVYPELNLNTMSLIPTGSHMISGAAVGRFLQNMVRLQRPPARILEVGTFSGYATAWMWEGLFTAAAADNEASSSSSSTSREPYLLSMERDPKAFSVAVEHMRFIEQYGCGEAAAEAVCALRSGQEVPPTSPPSEHVARLTFHREGSTCDLWKVTDALASLESSTPDDITEPFDMVFLDADKTRLVEYMEAFLSTDRLLRKGGIVIVDNVLWKGLVLDAAAAGGGGSVEYAPEDEVDESLRRNRRARKLANKMHRFNTAMANDPRVEVLVLPMRDGLSLIRKK